MEDREERKRGILGKEGRAFISLSRFPTSPSPFSAGRAGYNFPVSLTNYDINKTLFPKYDTQVEDKIIIFVIFIFRKTKMPVFSRR